MATVPLFQLGQHVTSLVVVGQTKGTAGALTDSTTTAIITTTWKGVEFNYEVERAEVNASSTTRHNELILADGCSASFDVLSVNNGGDPTPLRTLYFAFDYFKVVAGIGTGGSAKTITGYFVRGNFNDKYEGRGEQVAHLELGPCDIGSAQVTVA